MKVILEHDQVVLLHGDSARLGEVLPPNSVDAIVCDPPAGISFMGKSWDDNKGGRDKWIAWLSGLLEASVTALKPGGYALVWAIPRTSHWTATALENAGLEVRDVVMHLFGTGFPKSLDISKAIDAAGGMSPAEQATLLRSKRDAASMTREQLAALIGCTESSVRDWEEGRARKEGAPVEHMVPSPEYRARLADVLGYSADERRVTGVAADRRGDGTVYGVGHSGTMREGGTTDAAQKWKGWGTALKPAAEHWILARKPLEGTYAENVLKYGTGGLNIDGCRIGTESTRRPLGGVRERADGWGMNGGGVGGSDAGRWPANVTLDEEAAAMLDAQSGKAKPKAGRKGKRGGSNAAHMSRDRGDNAFQGTEGTWPADPGGGASRFFYVAKAPRKEKDAGLDHLPKRSGGEVTDREDGSAGLNNPRAGAGRTGGARNFHPTVKSVALMRWLIRLITPPGGTVLDPFAGSGSTGVAAIQEGVNFIGCELGGDDGEYLPILVGRIRHALGLPPEIPTAEPSSEVK